MPSNACQALLVSPDATAEAAVARVLDKEWTRVAGVDAALERLSQPGIDLVLCDSSLGDEAALRIAAALGSEQVLLLLVRPGAASVPPPANVFAWLPSGDLETCAREIRHAVDHIRLARAERTMQQLEAMNRLTGSVAHEFNNMLSVILGYTDLLLHQQPENVAGRGFMEEIQRAGERATWLNRQLLTFTRRQVLKVRPHDLNTFLTDMDGILRRFLGADIELVTVWAPDLRPIRADIAQLEQIIMSLAMNARAAMPRGGKFVLETHNDIGTATPESPSGVWAVLAVSHTGRGLDPQVAQRLQQASFAADAAAGKLDLGLAVVADIVAQHRGRLEVSSDAKTGTAFKLFFPAIAGDLAAHARPSWFEGAPGTETILLVDDEQALRTMIRHVLEPEGYKVLEAPHGAQAIVMGKEHPGPVHLLIADVVMPQVTGLQVAERLASLRPEMRILFFSGLVDASAVRDHIHARRAAFLQKPFTRRALLQKVREALETPAEWDG